jgi:hypothetical protein
MATIIAGGFEAIVQAERALSLLSEAGVNSEYLCQFRVNPPGMHGANVIDGDRDKSPGRPAEALIAVNVDGAGISEEEIVQCFEQAGAWQIERTDGLWEDGEWKDFDAVSPPHLIGGRDPEAGANPASAR